MALWDKPETSSGTGTAPAAAAPALATSLQSQDTTVKPAPKERLDMKESLIASGLTIEGKINGNGHVRVAGKFKGDIQVEGNLHIDSGAKVEGQVKASEVIVSGELQGNIESAKRVELQQGGTINGDVKAGSFTVAAGARMRGSVDFGFEEGARSTGSSTTSLADRSRGANVA
jgi:cytoskeletal protein CcmA (bactofilin family)